MNKYISASNSNKSTSSSDRRSIYRGVKCLRHMLLEEVYIYGIFIQVDGGSKLNNFIPSNDTINN